MELMFDGELFVHYGFVFLNAAEEEPPDLDDSRAGQVNGLLGAAVPGALALMAATHTGDVSLRIEWHDREPAIDPVWEEVVEASLEITNTALLLSTFDDFHDVTAPVTGAHRVRLSAKGMDVAAEQEISEEDAPAPDHYLLQLWPACPAADVIVRQSSQSAAYWHSVAQASSPVSTEQIAAHVEERNRPSPVAAWTPPASARNGPDVVNAFPLSAKVEAPAWLARRACEAAGIAYLPWVRSALEALRGNQPLPGIDRDSSQALAALVLPAFSDRERARLALDTIFFAAEADPMGDLGDVVTAAQATLAADGEDAVDELLQYMGFDR